jgi:DNA-binding response OmpR family regulator
MKRILVVDDDEAVRGAFRVAFSTSDCSVRTVPSAAEGIAALNAEPADLIFLDLNMPAVDGVTTLREIRKTDRVTPVFIVTAFADQFMGELRAAAIEGLDFNLLRKPLGVEEIVAAGSAAIPVPF